MKTAFRKTTTAFAAVATAGVSGLFVGVAPASAATETCGPVGTLVSPGVCELVFTNNGVFNRTAEMTKLEVLLVGAGGDSVGSPYTAPTEGNPGTNGYAAGGGGGEVRLVNFSSTAGPVTVTVADAATDSTETSATAGTTVESAFNADDGSGPTSGTEGASGGDSGNENQGVEFDVPSSAPYGAGGGADSAASGANGGDGVVVNTLALAGSLFATDSRCFGGGGGVGVSGIPEVPTTVGTAGCGAGYSDASGLSVVAPVANSGGGAGGASAELTEAQSTGADGVVILRWNSWHALAATGGGLNTTTMSIGISVLVAGIGLAMAAAYTRKRRAND